MHEQSKDAISMHFPITGVLLVGGKSRRMGTDKAFLKVDGVPLYARVLKVLEEIFPAVILVGDSSDRFIDCRFPVYPDIYPGSALGGLFTGLHRSETDCIFVAPCDIPFPSAPLIRHLCTAVEGNDAVVPMTASGLEPLFASYRKTCLHPMKVQLDAGNFRIRSCFPDLKVRYIGEEEIAPHDNEGRSFININTPADFSGLRTLSIYGRQEDSCQNNHLRL